MRDFMGGFFVVAGRGGSRRRVRAAQTTQRGRFYATGGAERNGKTCRFKQGKHAETKKY
jgi:hypothetical protein